jgi:predicted nucleic acid-binding protein
MDDDPILLDTNVLLNATAPARPLHESAKRALNDWPNRGVPLCTSGQILREYLVVATRAIEWNGLGLSLSHALENAERLKNRMRFLDETRAAAEKTIELVRSTECLGKQIHDANVVGTALAHGVPRILTQNESHFARFKKWVEIRSLGEV